MSFNPKFLSFSGLFYVRLFKFFCREDDNVVELALVSKILNQTLVRF